jgi:23S rRNA (adenine2503-C2)-methyltransferase
LFRICIIGFLRNRNKKNPVSLKIESKKQDIRNLSRKDLAAFFEAHAEKSFRANQVYDWLWKKNVANFTEMTNLSMSLRRFLDEHFYINKLFVAEKQVSEDRTIKSAFQLMDKKVVEGVLIPTSNRMTACISSQVGCSLSCKFCATGSLKRMRNLEPSEIYDQVVCIKNQALEHYGQNLSNIVLMGMGEPLLNYKNVMEGIRMITSEDGLGMSPKRITLSTAGIAKMICQLADDSARFNLALSLHAANDDKRNEIMPINESNSLSELAESLKYFYQKTRTRITYEYIIFRDFNDELKDAAELANFCKHVPCKVNIIEYNPIEAGDFHQASRSKVDAFAQYLEDKNIIVNVRRSRGKDIDAACGQLANKNDIAAPIGD